MVKEDLYAMCRKGQFSDPRDIDITGLTGDMWPIFQETTVSLLSELEAAAMALEAGYEIHENTSFIRRTLHSIKGNCAVVSLAEVHNICHQAESAFEDMTADTSASADMVLKVKDWIESVIHYISQGDIAAEKQEKIDQINEKPKPRALIIDDAPVCRQRLQSILKDFFDCTFAVNGRLGLEEYIDSRTKGNPYEIITLDINMPELDGHETLEAIRAWEKENGVEGINSVKIIMIASESSSKHIFSSFKQGCESYVVKSDMGDKLPDELAKLGFSEIVKMQKN